MSKLIFPKGFWWGAATSGPQTEGFANKPNKSVMDYWYEESPEAFHNNVGPNVASNFYETYEEDIKLMKEIGFNSFRTSIQWTRLIDNIVENTINQDAVNFYNNMINKLLENDITPIINLFHFDMPIELQHKNDGWLKRETVDHFVEYAKIAFDLFGDRVEYWTVFNEPMVIPEAGYFYGFHYPNKIGKGKEGIQIMYHLALATAKTIKVFNDSVSKNNHGKIGTILNLTPAYPATDSEEDIEVSEFVDDLFNNFFVESAINGRFPKKLVDRLIKDNVMWEAMPTDRDLFEKNKVDFLGVNYYHPKRVKARETELKLDSWLPDIYYEEYDMPNKRMNVHRGWEIYPKAIYDIGMIMKNNYPEMPWFISENGMGVEGEEKFEKNGIIEDDYRIDFYQEHLEYLHKAIEEGSNCFGYHAWTAFDCWSWNNAYKNRYGFIAVDLSDQKRTVKRSGYWLKDVSENNGFRR